MSMIRTRWAAIGAAVAVALGGGGLFVANAADSTSDSLFHPVTPVRVMDTRVGGTAVVNSTVKLDLEGTIATYNADGSTTNTEVVPDSATSVAINLTVTGGQKNGDYGFVTAFPCTATADAPPTASSLNFENRVDIANALNVTTSGTGEVCFNVYGTAHLIVDVAGYYDDSRIDAIASDYLDNDSAITMAYSANTLLPTVLGVGTISVGGTYTSLGNAAGLWAMPLVFPYQVSTSSIFGRYQMSAFSVCLPATAFTSGGNISEILLYDADGILYDSGTLTAGSWTADSCRNFTLPDASKPAAGSKHYNLLMIFEDTNGGGDGDIKVGSISSTFSPCSCNTLLFPIPPIIFPFEN